MPARARIVLLAGDGLSTRVMYHSLREEFDVVEVVLEDATSTRTDSLNVMRTIQLLERHQPPNNSHEGYLNGVIALPRFTRPLAKLLFTHRDYVIQNDVSDPLHEVVHMVAVGR